MNLDLTDYDRQKVYGAESLTFESTLFQEDIGDDVMGLSKVLFESDWWTRNIGVTPVLRYTRREAIHSTGGRNRNGDYEISFSLGGTCADILVHEAAHVATMVTEPLPVVAHGCEFLANRLDLTMLMCGKRSHDRLAAAFAAQGLDIGTRRLDQEPAGAWSYGLYQKWRADRFSVAS